jgi:hypothetical protein
VPARIHICLTFFSGILLFLFVPVCSASTLLSNGQLTVQADGVPLAAILEEISRQGNISIQTQETLAGQMVTIHFGPLPLEKGLKRILKKYNYLATFDKNGNIIKLIISSKVSAPLSGGYSTLPQVEPAIPVPPEPSEIVSPQEQPHPELPEAKDDIIENK